MCSWYSKRIKHFVKKKDQNKQWTDPTEKDCLRGAQLLSKNYCKHVSSSPWPWSLWFILTWSHKCHPAVVNPFQSSRYITVQLSMDAQCGLKKWLLLADILIPFLISGLELQHHTFLFKWNAKLKELEKLWRCDICWGQDFCICAALQCFIMMLFWHIFPLSNKTTWVNYSVLQFSHLCIYHYTPLVRNGDERTVIGLTMNHYKTNCVW